MSTSIPSLSVDLSFLSGIELVRQDSVENHLPEILDQALFRRDSKAFSLFAKIPTLLHQMVSRNLLYPALSKILAHPQEDFTIGRICSLMLMTFADEPEAVINLAGFTTRFIQLIDKDSVYYLFKGIYSPELITAQTALKEFRVADLLAREVSLASNERKLVNCLRILQLNQEAVPELIKTIPTLLGSKSVPIKNSIWEMIGKLTNENTVSLFTQFVPDSIEEILSSETPSLSCVAAIDFLTNVILLKQKVEIENCIQPILLKFFEFPDCSNLMSAIFRFVRGCIRLTTYRMKVLTEFLPVVACEATSKQRNSASAQCMALMLDLQKQRQIEPALSATLAKFDVFEEFVQQYFKKYETLRTKRFGGLIEMETHPSRRPSSVLLFQ